MSEKSAMKCQGKTGKEELNNSPFELYFQYGTNKERHWNFDQIALQFKDCVDCFEVLHGKEFKSCWIFDHSCGHDRGREDGLNISNMGVKGGGKQATLCDSKIIADNEFLGPHNLLLKVKNIQQFNFQEGDDGPYYLNTIQRDLRKNNVRGRNE